MPVRSPSGHGLALLRQYRDRGDSVAVCSIASPADRLQCTPIDRSLSVGDVAGLRADHELIIAASRDDSWALYAINLLTATDRELSRTSPIPMRSSARRDATSDASAVSTEALQDRSRLWISQAKRD